MNDKPEYFRNETEMALFAGQERTKRSKRLFLQSYTDSLGRFVSVACHKAGVGRASYYRWLNEDPQFARECKLVERMCYDYVKDKLLMKIVKGSIRATITYLKLYDPEYGGTPDFF